MSDSLDQLAEQAQQAARQCAAYLRGQQTRPQSVVFATIIREALEDATQALREQLAQVTQELDLYAKKARDWNAEADKYLAQRDELTMALTARREDLERYRLAAVSELQFAQIIKEQRQELACDRAALDLARGLPFCGHRDCEGGQHPARNCLGCETLWERWREALAACTPTKSAG